MPQTEEIYQKYANTVYKYLLSKTRNTDLAQELTQETFYRAIRASGSFDGTCTVSTWLCAIARQKRSAKQMTPCKVPRTPFWHPWSVYTFCANFIFLKNRGGRFSICGYTAHFLFVRSEISSNGMKTGQE